MVHTNRKISIIAGLLIISGIIAGIFSIVPSVEGEQYLSEVSKAKNPLLFGAIFQFLLVPIYVGFAILLYPLLKKTNTSLAIGFVGFRIISAVFQLIGMILLPMFLLLSENYADVNPSNQFYFEATGELLKLGRDLTNHLGVMLATGIGNLFLYTIFFRSGSIPNWLSLWGFLANCIAILSSFLLLFGSIEVVSITFVFLTIPLVIQEIVLSIWLIVKGFKKSKND